jgi:hypothetical protein
VPQETGRTVQAAVLQHCRILDFPLMTTICGDRSIATTKATISELAGAIG